MAKPAKLTDLPPPAKRSKKIDPVNVRASLLAIEKQLNGTFVQRTEAIRVILLGVLSGNNYMFIGDPGTAKTSVIDLFTKHVEAKRFKTLMGKFTQPDDVFGSLDIKAFKAGKRRVVTDDMFTDCPFPILDETLKSSDGCMNSLLGVLGPEREFQGIRTKVVSCGGATNWPEVDGLSPHVEALYDRFLLRCNVVAVDRSNKDLRRKLYRAASGVRSYKPKTKVSVADIEAANREVLDVEITDQVIDMLDGIVGRIMGGSGGSASVIVSDRRSTQLQTVLQANAWLEGRDYVSIEDFEVLKHGLWSRRGDIETIKAVLETIDNVAVSEIIDMAQAGRVAYRDLQQSGFGVANVNKVTEQIMAIAFEVQTRLKQPIFTKGGRARIKKAMAALRADFEDLNTKANANAGKGG